MYRLLDEITRLAAPGSELVIDTVGRSMLDSPHTRPLRDKLASEGAPWQFGTDHPEDELLEPRGWRASVWLYSEIGTRLGRWPHPIVPRGTPEAPQSFLVHATR